LIFKSLCQSNLDSTQQASNYLRRCSTEHIETVIVPLWIWHLANTWSFQQISSDSSPRNSSTLIKLNLHKLTKTTVVTKWHK